MKIHHCRCRSKRGYGGMTAGQFLKRKVMIMAKKMNRVKAALAGALFAVSALAVPATLPEQMADFAARDAVLTASAADYDNYAKLLHVFL